MADGQRFDGRIFRLPAAKRDTPEHEAQDRVSGQVVYQHWSVKLPAPAGSTNAPGVDVNHVFFIASARVEFGKQSGKTLPGKLHLCVPGNQSVFGGELKEPIEIVGSFTATLE